MSYLKLRADALCEDEQLAATQKGLQGVAMPNFGAVGSALAKETNWEPEEEQETEDERA